MASSGGLTDGLFEKVLGNSLEEFPNIPHLKEEQKDCLWSVAGKRMFSEFSLQDSAKVWYFKCSCNLPKKKTTFDRQLQEGRIAASKVCLQALPLSLANFFVHFFPKKRACSQARIYHANRTTAGEVFWFWTVSPKPQIRVWYLPNNRHSCYFL